ncbi:TolC family protein [Geitlerinema sp. PCC 9228]|uniref:TolC family protein n=1 Tax=Geitlerinema sp. PCC 9228 TaxID=111611 RepID=UPI0008F992F8|nr:TolC family protein [Geitlerinema sp. PCC 9228]
MLNSREFMAVGISALMLLNLGSSRAAATPKDLSAPDTNTETSNPNLAQATGEDNSENQNNTMPASSGEPMPVPGPEPPEPTIEAPSPAPETPSNLESLYPNANPLQFPTQPEEVEVQEVRELTLQQARRLALRNNRDLQQARLQLEQSKFRLREALAAWLPNLDLNTSISRQDSAATELQNEVTSGAFQQQDITTSTWNAAIQLSYDVYTGGRRTGQIRASRKQLRRQELEVERQVEDILLEVTNAYYDVQQAEENVRIAEQAVKNARQSLRDAEALEEAGLGTRFEVLQSEVNLSNEVQNLTQARSDLRSSQRELSRLLSVPQSVTVTAVDDVDIAGLWNYSLEKSIVLALKNRAELEQQLLQREISEAQRQVALSNVRPQVSISADYNLLDEFDDGTGIADGNTVQATIQWRLYDGGAAVARARQEEKNREIAENRFANLRQQIRTQVEQAFFDLQANLQNIETARKGVEQAREALRLARLRFQAGVGTNTDVLDAETELTRSEGNLVRAILGYNRALAQLQRSLSNLDQQAISVPDAEE